MRSENSRSNQSTQNIIFPFLCLAIGLFVAGCKTPPAPDIATHVDRHSGIRTDLIPDNLIETEGPTRELLWLNASRVFKNQQDYSYYLEVHYEARAETGLLEIAPGASLIIMADDRQLKLSGTGSLNSRQSRSGIVSEDALYQVGPPELRAIARAKKLKVRVVGKNGIVERDFAPANFERFKKFVRFYVDSQG